MITPRNKELHLVPINPATRVPYPAHDRPVIQTVSQSMFPAIKTQNMPVYLYPMQAPTIDWLLPLQTPTRELLTKIKQLTTSEFEQIYNHYSAVLPCFKSNVFHDQGMLIQPSHTPYFPDISDKEAGHLLYVPAQRSYAQQQLLTAKLHEILECKRNGQELDPQLSELEQLCHLERAIPLNTPRLDMLLDLALQYPQDYSPRVFGQNCAPRSASIPTHLHLQILPQKDRSGRYYFPFLEKSLEQRFIQHVQTLNFGDDQQVEVYGVDSVGTVVGMNLSSLSDANRLYLAQRVNDLITESQKMKEEFGVDVLATNNPGEGLVLYLGFRNAQAGGLYATFGLISSLDIKTLEDLDRMKSIEEEPLWWTNPATFNPLFLDALLSSNREPGSQLKSAEFLAKLSFMIAS